MPQLKIFSLSDKNERGGCHEWRVDAPARYLRSLGHIVDTEEPGALASYDIVVINRSFMIDLPGFIKRCQKLGIKIVYDTDDFILGLEPNNWYHSKTGELARMGVKVMLKNADLITVSTHELKDIYSTYTDVPIVVTPNLTDHKDFSRIERKAERPIIGWAGSMAHAADLITPLEAVRDLQDEIDFQFVLFGITEQLLSTVEAQDPRLAWVREWANLKKVIDEIRCKRFKRFIPGTNSYEEYKRILKAERWDFGIAPLLDTRFNRCKSAVKYYEYVGAGIPCLASKVMPYTDTQAHLVKNRYGSWKAAIRYYLENQYEADDLWFHQTRDIKANATMEKNGHIWEEAYLDLVKEKEAVAV